MDISTSKPIGTPPVSGQKYRGEFLEEVLEFSNIDWLQIHIRGEWRDKVPSDDTHPKKSAKNTGNISARQCGKSHISILRGENGN